MVQNYRGYPQPWTGQVEQPYIVYSQEDRKIQEPVPDHRWQMQVELDYFRGLYPPEAKKLRRVAETEFDRIDQDGGPMYDEYPDREFLYRVCERMMAQALAEGIAADRDLMQVIMLHELLRRRAWKR